MGGIYYAYGSGRVVFIVMGACDFMRQFGWFWIFIFV